MAGTNPRATLKGSRFGSTWIHRVVGRVPSGVEARNDLLSVTVQVGVGLAVRDVVGERSHADYEADRGRALADLELTRFG